MRVRAGSHLPELTRAASLRKAAFPASLATPMHAVVGGQIIELRVPYPMGFFTEGLEGRIDDPKAGWKGRALWALSLIHI